MVLSRVSESSEGVHDVELRQTPLERNNEILAPRRSGDNGPKSPDVRVSETAPQSIFGRLQSSVIGRIGRGRAAAHGPPLTRGDVADISLPSEPQPAATSAAAPSEFPGPQIRPQTARSNYSSRSNNEADVETQPRPEIRYNLKFKQWWKRPELKTRVIILLVWAMLLLVVVSLYLGLAINRRLATQELHVALILIILISAMFFCHSLIRLCVIATRSWDENSRSVPPSPSEFGDHQIYRFGPLGYAQPLNPIPIQEVPGQATAALVVDDDDDGRKLPPPPPAYGLWRQSVRVNPNQFYWVRRSEQQSAQQPPQRSTTGSSEDVERSVSSERRSSTSDIEERQQEQSSAGVERSWDEETRPPSYASADRVQFEESAQQMAYHYERTAYLPRLPIHPSERGRVGSL